VRAQRRTQKEVGLEYTLFKSWWWNTDLSMLKANALWLICMYYLRNIGPHFFMEFFFSKKWNVDSKLRWPFHSCLLESLLVILTFRKGLISSYFFVLHSLSQGLPILPDIFLRKGIMEPALPVFFYCPPAWSCPQVF